MKIKISYVKWFGKQRKIIKEIIEVPKQYQFVFQKDEDEYTDNEWDKSEAWYKKMANKYDHYDIEDIF